MATARTWRNRIVGHGDVPPSDLVAHPLNFRTHPKAQADALVGILDEVGFVQSVIVNQMTGRLVDGHLRVELAIKRGESSLPVVYVELTEDEERLVLATLDPLAAMAEHDAEQLSQLLSGVSSEDAAVQVLLSALANDAGIVPPEFEAAGMGDQGRLDEKAKVTCPECGHAFEPS